uniref:Protein EARLY HEADING DATE 2 n=1 Tax=Zea mays TaxID=4577 RepID=A0A804PLC7_MAIZE
MASNSSAAAVAAMFGIRDADHQDQMKPLLAQQHQHQHQHQMPPAPLLNAASSSAGPGQAAGATPPAVKKKRNLPDPDAEVIALSPKTLLATNRFVCEVCNKGFQREQNLQLHRRGHNLPWKLKQKDPSQAQRRRVYLCPEPTCAHHDPSRALGDLTGIKKHFCRKHGEKKWKCDKCSKRYAVQSDWKAHSKVCGTREYRCDCGTLFSRRDSFITHRAFCDALAQESARLPPPGLTASHLYGATNAANMGLSLSQEFGAGDGSGSHGFLQGKPFHSLMHLPDLQGNGAGGASASSATGLFNLGYIANSANSSGTSSHGHASQGHLTSDQFSEGGGGGGSESSAAMLFSGGGNFAGGDHQVAPGGMYNNDPAVMLPQMSATALLQKASQMGSSASAHGGVSVFGGLVGSSAPSARHARAPMLDQSQMHLQSLMSSLAAGGMFGGANSGSMIDPRMYDMNQDVKFSQGRGGAEMTRDFLGVGGDGVMRGMTVARAGHQDGADDMNSLEAEMKSASSPFTGDRMQ